jgi:choline-phosphate cytidylyltransferase
MATDQTPKRIYCDGVYDLFHYGHARLFESIKKAHPNCQVIAGICTNQDIIKYKGKPVTTEFERREVIKRCKWVDDVISPCPWKATTQYLKEHNIDFLAHDNEYLVPNEPDFFQDIKDAGLFLATPRTNSVSTSEIIARVIKDRDAYIWRNLSLGISRKEMNVSYLHEQWLKFKFVQIPKIKSLFQAKPPAANN